MAKRQKDNKRETFSLTAPAAKEVVLVGDFTHWDQKPVSLKKGADGVWQTRVELAPGEHHYRFIVDGQCEVIRSVYCACQIHSEHRTGSAG